MKKRFRRKITPAFLPTEPQEPDVIWKDGMITLQGETLIKVEAMAEAEGLTVEQWVDEAMRRLIAKDKEDPGYLQELVSRSIAQRRIPL